MKPTYFKSIKEIAELIDNELASQMPEDYLKTCPFCGGNATLEDGRKLNVITTTTYKRPWQVLCKNYKDCTVLPSTMSYATKEEAITAWNARKE